MSVTRIHTGKGVSGVSGGQKSTEQLSLPLVDGTSALAPRPVVRPKVSHLRAVPTPSDAHKVKDALRAGSAEVVTPAKVTEKRVSLDHGQGRSASALRRGRIALDVPSYRVSPARVSATSGVRGLDTQARAVRGTAARAASSGAASVGVARAARSSAYVRVLVGMVVTAVIVVLALALGTSLLPSRVESVVVQNGDTVWSIASRVEDAPSTAAAANDILRMNGLGSETITAGQVLDLPSY